ncbi:MAG TPA: ester cyclase [Thermoanaerobaculia bacterium]|nr:ester cyclase [Thermoanaerobaculia bacterium]
MPVHPDARELGRRWFEEVWNRRNDAAIEELMAPDAYGHVEGGEYRGPAGFREMQKMFFSALSDVNIEVVDVIADGDRAAVRWRATGKHAGEGFGFKASHREFDVRGTTWLIVKDGKIVEGWDTWNLGGLLESLRS